MGECYLMNTNMTGFRWFSRCLHPCALEESSLSIGRVNLSTGPSLAGLWGSFLTSTLISLVLLLVSHL